MAETLLLDIWVLARLVGVAMDDAVEPSGLVGREYVLYALLSAIGATTPTDLARRSGVPATTISKMLRRMTARGHLIEAENPDDARSRLLRLTEEGAVALRLAHEGFASLTKQVLGELGAEAAQVGWSLERLGSALAVATGSDAARSSGPRPEEATAHALRYVGRRLTDAEEAQAAAFVDFVRRDG